MRCMTTFFKTQTKSIGMNQGSKMMTLTYSGMTIYDPRRTGRP